MTNGNRDAEEGGPDYALQPCPSCRTPMPDGLRFCRKCGFRLGEGVEEYTATRRFDSKPSAPTATAATTTNLGGGAAFNPMPGAWGAMAPSAPAGSALKNQCDTVFRKLTSACNPTRGNWIITLILLLTLMTAGILVAQRLTGTGRFAPPPPPVSFLGVDGLQTADGGGAFVEGIRGVNTSVERAGLIGGDVITVFDGRKIDDADDLRRALRETPPGKTVEVVYIRDGETRTTRLTTMTEKDFQGLGPLDARPGGQGRIGVDVGGRKRVPGANTYGVELDDVNRNGPADLGGLKEGDIVTQFNEFLIRTPGDLRYRIYAAVPGTMAEVVVIRNGERVVVPVKVGRSKD